MQKGRALFFAGLTTVSFVLAAVACDDEASSKFEETPDSGRVDSAPPPSFAEDAGTNEGGGPVTCDPTNGPAQAPWKAPTKKNACSAQQLGEYYDACLTTQAPDAGNPCKTWTDANKSCAECVEPTDNSGPIQWHRDRYYYTLNVAGCIALERNEPNAGQCSATYHDSVACQRAVCDGCFSAPNATFTDFQNCQKKAKDTACTTAENTFKQTCGEGFNEPDGGAFDCFRKNDDDAKKHFVRVEGIFCGP